MSTTPEQTEDPCWQDLYDDDCSMSSVYSASFVAGKWIKSMPCASGLDEVRFYNTPNEFEIVLLSSINSSHLHLISFRIVIWVAWIVQECVLKLVLTMWT
jgi:hypothetical protein